MWDFANFVKYCWSDLNFLISVFQMHGLNGLLANVSCQTMICHVSQKWFLCVSGCKLKVTVFTQFAFDISKSSFF